MQLKRKAIAIAIVGLMVLGACSSGEQTTTATNNSTEASSTENQPTTSNSPTTSAEQPTTTKPASHGGQGGQVIESGPYHLELLMVKEADSTHIDFFLQKGDKHEPIPNAKVTAQVQQPDGKQQSLEMKYDPEGKHYAAVLPGGLAGEYKVVILSDINGEKVNGRFSFKQ